MEKHYRIIDALKDMTENELQEAWRIYCEANNYYDDEIYDMSEFDELCYGLRPLEILEKYGGEDFNVNDNYFIFTIYGAKSFNWIEDAPCFDYDALAEYAEQEDDDFDDDQIREILDEEDGDE